MGAICLVGGGREGGKIIFTILYNSLTLWWYTADSLINLTLVGVGMGERVEVVGERNRMGWGGEGRRGGEGWRGGIDGGRGWRGGRGGREERGGEGGEGSGGEGEGRGIGVGYNRPLDLWWTLSFWHLNLIMLYNTPTWWEDIGDSIISLTLAANTLIKNKGVCVKL